MKFRLSVVVVAHDMARELPRTLLSLAPQYQRDISADDYEVIVVDNGSREPFDLGTVAGLPAHWRLIRLDPAPPSPAQAINVGLAATDGAVVGVMIDGARMLTPGVLHFAIAGAGLTPRAVVTTLSWNIGWDANQRFAQGSGYNQAREDELLAGIDWPADGYRLFEIGAPTALSAQGWLQNLAESNALFMAREMWAEMGGADERFDEPAGGFLNLDMLRSALELPGTTQVVLLGEATFHQLHGDLEARANVEAARARGARWLAQYKAIRGRDWSNPPSQSPRIYVGTLPPTVLLHFTRTALEPLPSRVHPLGREFDPELWRAGKAEPTGDALADKFVAMTQREFRDRRYEAAAALARMGRQRFGDIPELTRILSLASPWLPPDGTRPRVQIEVHNAVGDAHLLLGDPSAAEAEYRTALAIDGDVPRAMSGLARVLMPGDTYRSFLTGLHRLLRPHIYLEIGVASGATLVLAEPPTVAIGVDPVPALERPARTMTHLFPLKSDEFFADGSAARILASRRIGLAFIDGLHHFDQALRDFANVERWATRESVIVFHDTYPLDARMQERERSTNLWTGDVWKAIAALREVRPDLDIFTIACPPSGLTVVTALDPDSRALTDRFDRTIAKYMDVAYDDVALRLPDLLNLLPAEWPAIARRLERALDRKRVGSALAGSVPHG